jgi:hypothetical protein
MLVREGAANWRMACFDGELVALPFFRVLWLNILVEAERSIALQASTAATLVYVYTSVCLLSAKRVRSFLAAVGFESRLADLGRYTHCGA